MLYMHLCNIIFYIKKKNKKKKEKKYCGRLYSRRRKSTVTAMGIYLSNRN